MKKIISILVALAVLMTLAGTASAYNIYDNTLVMDNFLVTNNMAAAAAPLMGTAAADAAPVVGQQCVKTICVTNSSVVGGSLAQGNGIIDMDYMEVVVVVVAPVIPNGEI